MKNETAIAAVEHFDAHSHELAVVLADSIEQACEGLNFDIRCLDWFSYTPDFFFEKEGTKVA